MKRLVISIALIFSLLGNLDAQDKFIDHLAVGISYGTTTMKGRNSLDYLPFCRETDGVGIEAAARITERLEVRAGISTTLSGTYSNTFSVEGVPDGRFVTKPLEIEGRYGALAGNLFFDFYPFRNTVHFTAGFYAGSNSLLRIDSKTDVPSTLASYNTGVLDMHGLTIPTDRDGRISARLKMPAVRPYVGVGISTGGMDRELVVFAVRLGAMYKGNNGMTIAGPGGEDVEIDYWSSDHSFARMTAWNRNWPVLPLLTLNLYLRLF